MVMIYLYFFKMVMIYLYFSGTVHQHASLLAHSLLLSFVCAELRTLLSQKHSVIFLVMYLK